MNFENVDINTEFNNFINIMSNENCNLLEILKEQNEYEKELKKEKQLKNDLIDEYLYLICYYNIQDYKSYTIYNYSIYNNYSDIKKGFDDLLKFIINNKLEDQTKLEKHLLKYDLLKKIAHLIINYNIQNYTDYTINDSYSKIKKEYNKLLKKINKKDK